MLGISTISGKYLWKGHQLVGCLDQFEDCLLQALLDLQSAWCTECCCHNLYHLISSPAICATLNWGSFGLDNVSQKAFNLEICQQHNDHFFKIGKTYVWCEFCDFHAKPIWSEENLKQRVYWTKLTRRHNAESANCLALLWKLGIQTGQLRNLRFLLVISKPDKNVHQR